MLARFSARTLTLTALAALFVFATATPSLATLNTGAFVPGQSVTELANFETLVGKKQQYLLYYRNWDGGFDASLAQSLINRGTIPYLTWEPWNRTLDGINSGAYDSYIKNYANGMKTVSGTIYLRPMHEFNGNWYPWGVKSGNTAAKYVAAFRRIVNLVRGQGATNVKFLWSPNSGSSSGAESLSSYFPGDSYVDLVAIDGYNFGDSQSWSNWQGFDSVFYRAYAKVTSITSKPIIIGETSSAEIGGSKSAWISDAFASIIRSYPKIVGIVWFNVNKETDWRVNSSSASLSAYQTAMHSLKDTTAPVINWVAPSSGSWLRGKKTMKASLTEQHVLKTQFVVDGVVRYTSYSSTPSWTWDTTKYSNGRHSFQIRTWDYARNYSASEVKYATVDNTRPSVYITAPTTSTLYKRWGGFNIKASAADNYTVARVNFYIDGKYRASDLNASYVWSWPLTYVSTGYHKISVWAWDKAGNGRSAVKWVYVK